MERILFRFLIALSLVGSGSIVDPNLALADDWGCQVLLCVANPGGPEQYAQCVSPIEKLWVALRHGDPFPTCDFGSVGSQGTGASNTFASGGYCRQNLLYWGGPEQSELLCNASGAINVEIDDQLYTRVWWGVGGTGTITEFYGPGSTQQAYDPSRSAQAYLQRMYRDSSSGGGGE